MSDKILRVSNIDAMVNTIKTHVENEINYTNEEIKNLVEEKANNNITEVGFLPNDIYEFEQIPNTWITEADNKTLDINCKDFLSMFYDVHVGTHSDGLVVNKNVIGKDETGVFDVVEYDFIPKNYNRVILLTSGLHSYELSAIFGLAHFVKDLMILPYKDDGFKYIRENVRVKIIPICNPWGFNQSPKTYANVNKVNPNRNYNFEGSWDRYPIINNEWDYKGSAPFSEQETKNMCNWLYYNKNIADFWIDCHTGYNDTANDNWILYQSYSPLKPRIEIALEKLTQRIKRKYEVSSVTNKVQIDSPNSIKIEWSEKAVGIPMMVLEQSPLRNKWCPTGRNNGGDAIREYATTLFVYIKEFLKMESKSINLYDYIYKIRRFAFESNCKPLTYYSDTKYNEISPSVALDNNDIFSYLDVDYGIISSANGNITEADNRLFTEKINVNVNSINLKSDTFIITIRCYDNQGVYIGAPIDTFESNGRFRLKANTSYIALVLKKKDDSVITRDEINGYIYINSIKYKVSLNEFLYVQKIPVTTTIGGIASVNGLETESSNRFRSDFISVTVLNNKIRYKSTGKYMYTMRCYDSNKQYVGNFSIQDYLNGGIDSSSTWIIGEGYLNTTFTETAIEYIRIVGKNLDDSDILNIDDTFLINDEAFKLSI